MESNAISSITSSRPISSAISFAISGSIPIISFPSTDSYGGNAAFVAITSFCDEDAPHAERPSSIAVESKMINDFFIIHPPICIKNTLIHYHHKPFVSTNPLNPSVSIRFSPSVVFFIAVSFWSKPKAENSHILSHTSLFFFIDALTRSKVLWFMA